MHEELKKRVLHANLDLVNHGLVVLTWGNASEIDRKSGVIAIKPSGVAYVGMTLEDIVLVDLEGKVVEGKWVPSSDTPTHIELYKHFNGIGGIVHTHSENATAFAQAGRSITAYGTTHADYFRGNIPCTRALSKVEIETEYEKNTGSVIAETFNDLDEIAIPGCLVKNHGPFTWGHDAADAVCNAVVLEECARIALKTEILSTKVQKVEQYLLDKHYERKHGKNAYYGQKAEKE